MVKSDHEKASMTEMDVCDSSITTGDSIVERQLYPKLSECFKKAKRIDIIVSFLMESGVRILMNDFREAVDRGVSIRIMTGAYLGITQPSALYLIKREFGDRIGLRFYKDKTRSFHSKSYIIQYDDHGDIFIGSSNISKSALSSGIEWNYRFSSHKDPDNFEAFCSTFDDLYENHSIIIDDAELKAYSKCWHRPAAMSELECYDIVSNCELKNKIEPRGAQIEALYALDKTREEGASKALIMAATGIGKTYLAAFDSLKYKRVLFVAHREEILKQAAESFQNVRNSDDFGFFNGDEKCINRSVIFASVATLGKNEYLSEEYFSKNYFQYIVIDEFHHAVSNQYRRIIEYFDADFLLGLTATPNRMDGKCIYELCDYNVPYEIDLKEGINKGMLVPFHYYGIYDETDYSSMQISRGKYNESELTEKYAGNVQRHDLIFKHYSKYGSNRALGFCCSRAHAEEMAAEFSKRGVPSVAVYCNADGEFSEERAEAINRLRTGNIRVIFSVDMFNEGVDVAEIDMVMFLRPTESPIVFMQQLGRGLRISNNKLYLNVLDFIGNYEKAGRIRYMLTGREYTGDAFLYARHDDYPDNCIIDFDMQLIDLFAEMDRKRIKLKELIRREFYRVKENLGRRPTRCEFYTQMDDDIYKLAIAHSKDNPFRDYIAFLMDLGELDQDEQNLLNDGLELLKLLETTSMTKVYKMPVLMAFCGDDGVKLNVTNEELLRSWKSFFNTNLNWKDLDKGITYQDYKHISDAKHLKKILQMPVHFLLESGKGLFVTRPGFALSLNESLFGIVDNAFVAAEMKDIIEYRTMDYYERRYNAKFDKIQVLSI